MPGCTWLISVEAEILVLRFIKADQNDLPCTKSLYFMTIQNYLEYPRPLVKYRLESMPN